MTQTPSRRIPRAAAPPKDAGVTLLELMISTVLMAIVLAAVITAFLAQNKLYRGLQSGRQTEDNARLALDQMARLVHEAGLGISPAFAFDLDFYQCGKAGCRDNVGATGTPPVWFNSTTLQTPPSTANLRIHPKTDELVFYARSDHYYVPPAAGDAPGLLGDVWQVDPSSDSTNLVLDLHAKDSTIIPGNAVMLVTCPSAYTYLYATTGIGAVKVAAGTGTVSVPLRGSDSTSPFRQNTSGNMAAPCIGGGLAKAFLVNRYRFFVGDDPTSKRPFLFLDQGTDTTVNGLTIDAPAAVAADIEDLQVAYLVRGQGRAFNGANPKGPLSYFENGSWGTTPEPLEGLCDNDNECGSPNCCAHANCPAGYPATQGCANDMACSNDMSIDTSLGFYRSSALFPCGVDSAQRLAQVPGNIVAVRLTVVARTAQPHRVNGVVDTSLGDPPNEFSVEDHDRTSDPPDGYGRVRLSMTVDVPNTASDAIPMM